jgi:hypothetical protein
LRILLGAASASSSSTWQHAEGCSDEKLLDYHSMTTRFAFSASKAIIRTFPITPDVIAANPLW